ncbi:FG-GAP-like repeat-containing protein [Terricaulis sp.]|uniref:FG-GAP-like repeat-containing protein n=1 Tax=Terricaulis sp. TaxID=2768686 RepID=UPI0037852FC5
MPTSVPTGNFFVFDDETYADNPAFFYDTDCHFINEGTILSNVAAFDCFNGGGQLENRGLVHVYGSSGTAYGIYSENNSPDLVNSGSWWVESSGGAYGIYTWTVDADFTNTGDFYVGAAAAYGIFFANGGVVINEGDFIVEANGQAVGIRMEREGYVVNSGLIQATGSFSYGIRMAEAYYTTAPNITNSGTITATVAIHADVNGSLNPSIYLLNTATGVVNGDIEFGPLNDKIENAGVINGDVFMDLGNDIMDTSGGRIVGWVYLGEGNDQFTGGAYASQMRAGTGDDIVVGGSGGEEFYGESGADNIQGNGGADYISGGSAPDTLSGGDGDDVIDGGTGTDTIAGGLGFDAASYETATGAVTVSLMLQGSAQNTGAAGADTLTGIEDLIGSTFNDTLTGDGAGNFLYGLAGADTLNGGGGIDVAFYDGASSGASWHRNPDGTWSVDAGAEGVDALSGMEFLSFSDRDVFLDAAARTFSGDGTSDVLFRRTDGIMASWNVAGTSVSAATFLPAAGAEWTALGTGDFNGDGRADVLWQRSDGLVYSWHMDVTVQSANALAGIGGEWSFLGIGDWDGDLKDDVAWQRNDGVVFVWKMDGAAISSASAIAALGPEWSMQGVGDFNSDGRDDFVWRNAAGEIAIWSMNGGVIGSSGLTSATRDLSYEIAGIGDTNGDGRDDIVFRHGGDGEISIWFMDGVTVVSSAAVAAVDPATWSVQAVGDYNGDGRDDILWRNTDGVVYAWLLNGASVIGAGGLSGVGAEWSIVGGG